jgi:hypothetical protein
MCQYCPFDFLEASHLRGPGARRRTNELVAGVRSDNAAASLIRDIRVVDVRAEQVSGLKYLRITAR